LNSGIAAKDLFPLQAPIRSTALHRLRQLPQTLSADSLKQALYTVTIGRAPIQPVLIAGAPDRSINTIEGQIIAIATVTSAEVRIGIGPTVNAASNQLRAEHVTENHNDQQLVIAIPSFVLNTLPSSQYNGWNMLLQQQLGFSSTSPDILGYISQFDTTHIIIDKEDIALSVTGAVDAFAATINEWAQEDERHHRPQEQSFILPDGSIGRETIPGAPQPVLTPPKDGCRSPINDNTHIWLCQSDQRATISTTQNFATSIPQIAEEWQVAFSPSRLGESFCKTPEGIAAAVLCQATYLQASGFNNHASILLSLPEH